MTSPAGTLLAISYGMNAITPNVNVPTLLNATFLSDNSLQPTGQTSDFERTLRDTGDKPVRKTAAHRSDADKSGDQLPASGNNPPVAAVAAAQPPAPPATQTVKAVVDAGTAAITNVSGSAARAAPAKAVSTSAAATPADADAAAGASAPPPPPPMAGDDSGAATPTAAPTLAALAETTSPPKTVPSLPAGTTVPAAAKAPPAGTVPPAAADSTAPIKGSPAPTAVSPPVVDGQNTVSAKTPIVPLDNAKSSVASAATVGTHAAAKSTAGGAATATAQSGNAPAAAATVTASDNTVDVSSQTQLASAMAAAAAGVVAPATAASATDSLATPATGTAPSGIAGVAAAAGIAAVQPASAAAAASTAQVVIGAADTSAADKHGRTAPAELASTAVNNDSGAGFAQLVSNPSSTDAAPATLKVTAGVDTPEFAQGVGNQVSVMVDNNLNTAKLQVNPASLGPIEVRIAIQNGHAQVWMTSHSAVTRDALESSTPKLKEMLGAQGFSQVSVDISQRSFQERSPQSQSYAWQPPTSRESASASVQSAAGSALRSGSGVLDAYA